MQWCYLCHHPETCAAFSRWGRCFPMRVMIPESQMRTTNQEWGEWGEWGEGTHSISDPVFNASHVLPFSPSCSQWLERGVVPQRQCTGALCWTHFLPGLWPAYLVSRTLGGREPGTENAPGFGSVIQEGTQEGSSGWGFTPATEKVIVGWALAGFHSHISWPVSPPNHHKNVAFGPSCPVMQKIIQFLLFSYKRFYPCHWYVLSENTLNVINFNS